MLLTYPASWRPGIFFLRMRAGKVPFTDPAGVTVFKPKGIILHEHDRDAD